MNQNSDMVPVVTAFVYSGDKVVLIKRSRKVGTYKGEWAGFSGYVERLPLNQARVELHEEAALEAHQVCLKGIGIPLPVDDPESGRAWLVFPFLFELAEGVEIVTDWETEEWGWFHPSELDSMDTVPGLSQVLHRVWPPFGDNAFWNIMAGVATDTKHGATQLAHRALDALNIYVQENWQNMHRAALYRAVRAFAACRPSMGVFPDLASRLLLGICQDNRQWDFNDILSELISAVNDATALSAKSAAEALYGKRRIFTLSYSEAVLKTILEWRTGDSEVVVAESHPAGEGIVLYDRLVEHGVNAVLVPDSEIPAAAGAVDAVLVGCDAITEDNRIQNKVGTLAAVTAANENDVSTYAVTQTYKIVPPGWPLFAEIQSSEDIGLEPEEAQPASPIFESMPFSSFDAVYTEEGRLSLSRLEELQIELASVELIP